MRLVILQTRGSVSRNDIFSLKWIYYGPKGGILDYWRHLCFVYYPIISYQNINVYMVATMDTGISQWNNSVSGTVLISISTMVLIVQDMILW